MRTTARPSTSDRPSRCRTSSMQSNSKHSICAVTSPLTAISISSSISLAVPAELPTIVSPVLSQHLIEIELEEDSDEDRLPFTIISKGVAGNLNGTLGIPTHTKTPKLRSIFILCVYAGSLLAVQMTAWAPNPDVKAFTSRSTSSVL